MSDLVKTTLNVEGMTCNSCVRHVEKALSPFAGVREVQVKLQDGRVVVEHDRGAAPIETLVAALEDAGYPATPA